MVIRDSSQSLEVSVRERGSAGTQSEGDLGLNVAVVGPIFSGRNETVWALLHDWNRFTEQLAQLERSRSGQAVIVSGSPDDFKLRIFASDRAGHMMAEGYVGRNYYGHSGALQDRVTFVIEIDPTTG